MKRAFKLIGAILFALYVLFFWGFMFGAMVLNDIIAYYKTKRGRVKVQ